MRNVPALAEREIGSLFFSPLAHTILTIFLIFNSVVFFWLVTEYKDASDTFRGLSQIISFVFLVGTPLLTMRLLSEEYRSGSIESLMTTPVTETEIIVSKFLGAAALYLYMLIPTLLYPVILSFLGEPDWGAIWAVYLGLMLLGLQLVALGVLCSALTRNQAVAGILALLVQLGLWMLSPIGKQLAGSVRELVDVARYAAVSEHLTPFRQGRIAFRDVIYFLSLTAFWLFLAVRILEARRWFEWGPGKDRERSILKIITRLGILAGPLLMLAAHVAPPLLKHVPLPFPLTLTAVITGAVMFVLGILCNLKWLWRAICMRRLRLAANAWIQVVLALILLLELNAIVGMTPQTMGWFVDSTSAGKYSIGQKTRNVLNELDQPIRLDVIMGSGMVKLEPGRKVDVSVGEPLRYLVALYDAESTNLTAEVTDFDLEQRRCLEIEQAIGKKPLPDTVIVRRGNRHETIKFAALVKGPDATDIEAQLTGALIRVMEQRRGKVYVVSDHGTLALEGPKREAMSSFVAALRTDNYDVASLKLRKTKSIPQDCDVLIVVDPKTAITPTEISVLRKYLDGGGNLFALVGARRPNTDARAFLALLVDYNVRVRNTSLIWEEHPSDTGMGFVALPRVTAEIFGKHPVMEGLQTWSIVAKMACPVLPASAAPEDQTGIRREALDRRYPVKPLFLSDEKCWAFDADKRVASQDLNTRTNTYLVAVVMESAPSKDKLRLGPCMVICGSSRVVADRTFRNKDNVGNRAFAMNAVHWLARKEYKLGIPPRPTDRRPLKLSPARRTGVLWTTVVGMPLAAALCGIAVWWRRRRP